MSEPTRTKLRAQIQHVDWPALAPHAKRGALVLVDTALDLLDVAVAVAEDDATRVREWLEAACLSRCDPTNEGAELKTARFQFVIVQPYVLAQTIPDETAGPPEPTSR
jgi:hypothetical protein